MYNMIKDDGFGCDVTWCHRPLPKVYETQGYCSYHYRMKNEGKDPEKYLIRDKAPVGAGMKLINTAVGSNTNACIMWLYGKDSRGYGCIQYKGRKVKAHRLALMLYTNQEPDKDVFACHICDIPLCINPKHLYWGDAVTNVRDRHLFTTKSK